MSTQTPRHSGSARGDRIESAAQQRPTKSLVKDLLARYHAIYDRSPDCIYLHTLKGGFVDANPAALRLIGYAKEELAGINLRTLFDPADLPSVTATVAEILRKGSQENPVLLKLRRKDGSFVYMETVGTIIYEGGKPYAIQSIGRDMTEKMRLDEEKAHIQDQMAETQRLDLVGKLARGVGHDFNNLLAGMAGYADIIRRHNMDGMGMIKDPKMNHYAEAIITCCMRAKKLTDGLLQFSHSGKREQVPVDVHEVVSSVVSLLSESIDKRVTISQDLAAANPVVIGDQSQLRTMVLNVAMNSCEAMPGGGSLLFRTAGVSIDADRANGHGSGIPAGNYVEITITDTGAGMSADVLAKAFEPFFKAGQSNGFGLGLSSTLGIAKGHGGNVSLSSEEGKGTTVRILLPASDRKVEAPAGHGTEVRPAKQNATILIVEDEEMIRDVTSMCIKSNGHMVVTCKNGREGADYYREHWREIDVVLLDMVMPEMNGRQCFEAMKAVNPKVRVIITSGYAPDADAQAMLAGGALAFVQKPYTPAQLMPLMDKALCQEPL